MQISAADLLASQQAARSSPRPPRETAPFEPLPLKQAAKPAAQPAAEAAAPMEYVRPGTYVDIKV